MISLDIKTAYYADKKAVLAGFSLKAETGEIVTLTGASGSGKSTVLKIIAGLHKGFDGVLKLDSEKNTAPNIAMIPQNKYLLPWKNVLQSITILQEARSERPDHEKAATLIKALGLGGFEKQFPLRLSGGQYQRVMLGQALFCEPDILLLDEPFSALDDKTKHEIITLFLRLREDRVFTTVFVTHNMEEARLMGGRIVRLGE